MKKNIYIFALALGLLFLLSSCGKKENDDEIKLPLEINKNQLQNSISKLDLPKKTISQKEKNKIEENKIFGFAKNLANSTPQPLNTDVNYKAETLVNFTPQPLYENYIHDDDNSEPDPLPNITIYGQAVRTDGTAITNLYVKATPRGLYELSEKLGHFSSKINPDESGYFEIRGLIPGHYKLYVCANNSDTINTNVVLYDDQNNILEFVFPTIKYQTLKGIVRYEFSDEPAAGIKVKCKTGNFLKTIATTKEGEFEFTLPIIKDEFTRLSINETGFTKIEKPIRMNRYTGDTILFFLKKVGIITGKVTDESGKPVSRMFPVFYPKHEFDSKSKISLQHGTGYGYRFGRSNYSARPERSSNTEGIYIISNVAAPGVYILSSASGWNNYLPKTNHYDEIEVLPNQITTFDFKVFTKPVIKIQVKDEKGNPVSKYSLNVITKYRGSYRPGKYNVNLSDKNDWYTFNIIPHVESTYISLEAKTEDGQIARKDNIEIEKGKKYELVLKIGENPPDIAGFIYNSDMTPYIDGRVWANSRYGFASCNTDHLGYFELSGLNTEKEAGISISTRKDNNLYSTRAHIGDNDFEWILPKNKLITGRVCIGNINTPATNFAVSVVKSHNKKYFHSTDGTFTTQINSQFSKRSFRVYVFAANYAYESIEINMKNLDSYDIGDIILKNKPATVIGKIVDRNDNPVKCKAFLKSENEPQRYINANTDSTDGSFEFTDVPPGRYSITATIESAKIESAVFELSSGEYYTVPDLIW